MSIFDSIKTALDAAFDSLGNSIEVAFDSQKNIVFSGEPIEGRPNYNRYNVSLQPYVNHVGGQGFDVYNGYLFMVAGNGTTQVVDMETGETLTTVSITVGHGNSVSFSDEFLNVGDEFPLLYISKDQGDPCDVYVYHVEKDGSNNFTFTLYRTYRWQLSQVGYYANAAYDYENKIMYMLAYTEDSYQATTGNVMQITSWNMNTLTENQDGTFTPQYIGSVVTDYVIPMRAGQQFHDGMIWTGCGANSPKEIYAINPTNGNKVYTYSQNIVAEYEGESFIDDFNMLVGYNAGSSDGYYLFTFAKIYD